MGLFREAPAGRGAAEGVSDRTRKVDYDRLAPDLGEVNRAENAEQDDAGRTPRASLLLLGSTRHQRGLAPLADTRGPGRIRLRPAEPANQTRQRIPVKIVSHGSTSLSTAPLISPWRSSRSARSARARLRRWRSASGRMPQTAAASAGVRPSTQTSSSTSRYVRGSEASAVSTRRSSSLAAAVSYGD